MARTARRMASCLIVMPSIALLVSGLMPAMRIDGTYNRTLIQHSKPSEELTRAQLFAALDKVKFNPIYLNKLIRANEVDKYVADKLYKTKHSTRVYNGLTVGKLIEQNSFNGLTDCSQQALKERVKVIGDADFREQYPEGRTLAILVYAYQCLQRTIRRCLEHESKVIEAGINDGHYLNWLRSSLWRDIKVVYNIHFWSYRPYLPMYIGRSPRPFEWREADPSLEAQIITNGTLIAHPVPSEDLTLDELVAEFNILSRNSFFKIDEFVADKLYKTMLKESTIVVNDVSVAKLIELNSFSSIAECSQAALKKRTKTMAEADTQKFDAKGLTLGINVYVFQCLHKAIKYCLHKKDKVVQEGINEAKWLNDLEDKMWDDFYIEENVRDREYSKLPEYINNEPRFYLWDKGRRVEPRVNADGTLFAHPAPTEELRIGQLTNKLHRLNRISYLPQAEYILENLYKTERKASPDVFNHVTVAELIALNHFNESTDCNSTSLEQKSNTILHKLELSRRPETWQEFRAQDMSDALKFYVNKCLSYAAWFCDQRHELMDNKIGEAK